MILTEKEAKTKWCPFVRTGAYTDRGPMGAVTVNRDPREEVEGACRCIASACMAWAWAQPSSLPDGSPFHGRELGAERTGACGLAGRASEYRN